MHGLLWVFLCAAEPLLLLGWSATRDEACLGATFRHTESVSDRRSSYSLLIEPCQQLRQRKRAALACDFASLLE